MTVQQVVAGVIYDRGDGKILRARRRKELRSGGLWEFPGGKVEDGETLESALARELKEELSAEVIVGEILTRTRSQTPHGSIELICIWAELVGPKPGCSSDHDQLAWSLPTDLPATGWCAPDEEAVSRLRGGIALPGTGSTPV